MVFLDWKELPWFWRGFDNLSVALIAALVVPGLLAFAFGYLLSGRASAACISRSSPKR